MRPDAPVQVRPAARVTFIIRADVFGAFAFDNKPLYLAIMKFGDDAPFSFREETLWYPDHLDQYLNRWFATYEQARDSLQREGGYLFPYKHHYFVCEWGAVKAMGLDPHDPDWRAIGFDCVRPADPAAFGRLRNARILAALSMERGPKQR